jgi:hypothetical protein
MEGTEGEVSEVGNEVIFANRTVNATGNSGEDGKTLNGGCGAGAMRKGESMGKAEFVDPEYERWQRKYPRFPGVAECVRLIKALKARGSWADIILQELADNANSYLPELIQAFRTESEGDVRLYVMMALEMAKPLEAISFCEEVLMEGDPRLVNYAESTLKGIDTPEARTILWKAKHG